MFSTTWIVLVSILIFSFFAVLVSALLFAKPEEERTFSFSRYFPCEVSIFAGHSAILYRFFVYLFAGMCFSPLLYIIQGMGRLSKLNSISILISCVLGFAGLCFIFINIFSVTKTKPHLTLFGILATLNILSTGLIFSRGFSVFKVLSYYGIIDPISLISQYLAVLNGAYLLLVVFNRKLKTWASLELVDGRYVRSKKFPLAYSEWRLFLGLFMNVIIFYFQLLSK